MTNCLHCNSETTNPKFCNNSCAAKFNNLRRAPRTPEMNAKTSKSLLINGYYRGTFCKLSWCMVCNTMIKNSYRRTCSRECYRQVLSSTAKQNPQLGGNKNNKGTCWYNSPIAGRVWLESSYELKVAQELDLHQINWKRPGGLKYQLADKIKTYLPDFYLIDYDVYLDPKNSYLIKKDDQKIKAVCSQNQVKVFVLTKDQLTWESICSVLDRGLEPLGGLLTKQLQWPLCESSTEQTNKL